MFAELLKHARRRRVLFCRPSASVAVSALEQARDSPPRLWLVNPGSVSELRHDLLCDFIQI
jgi:hypothetical protein